MITMGHYSNYSGPPLRELEEQPQPKRRYTVVVHTLNGGVHSFQSAKVYNKAGLLEVHLDGGEEHRFPLTNIDRISIKEEPHA